jgi:hypothetical protein
MNREFFLSFARGENAFVEETGGTTFDADAATAAPFDVLKEDLKSSKQQQ